MNFEQMTADRKSGRTLALRGRVDESLARGVATEDRAVRRITRHKAEDFSQVLEKARVLESLMARDVCDEIAQQRLDLHRSILRDIRALIRG